MTKEEIKSHNRLWYYKTYNSLIDKCLKSTYSSDVYTEKHHILPKCMGGTDNQSNLVIMSAREHIIAHLLLMNAFPEISGLTFAANCMLSYGTVRSNIAKENLSTKTFSIVREENSKRRSLEYSKERHPMYGKKHSKESKKKISLSKLGRKMPPASDELRRKRSENVKGEKNPMYGKHLSNDHKKKLSNAFKGEKHPLFGKHLSNETKKKISDTQKGRKLPPERVAKISEATKGAKNPRAKKVITPEGKIYGCITELAKDLGICRKTLRKWINKYPEKGYRFI